MATITIDGPELIVGLSWLEKLGAFRGEVGVPLTAGDRSPRSPDTGIPSVLSLGTRRFPGGRDFAAVYAGSPAVHLDLKPPSPFARLTISVADAQAAIAAVRAATDR
jgi:hypothetical protein